MYNDRIGLESLRDPADADDDRPVVVDLHFIAHLERDSLPAGQNVSQLSRGASLIHDHPAALPEVPQISCHHARRAAHERFVVQTDDDAGLVGAIGSTHRERSFVERHRPLNPFHAAHAQNHCVPHRTDVVDVFHLRIDNPDVRKADVREKAESARHDPRKNTQLLRDQERGKGQSDDDADVFRPIAEQHLDRNEIHSLSNLPINLDKAPFGFVKSDSFCESRWLLRALRL